VRSSPASSRAASSWFAASSVKAAAKAKNSLSRVARQKRRKNTPATA
jgi:hypothetical protein